MRAGALTLGLLLAVGFTARAVEPAPEREDPEIKKLLVKKRDVLRQGVKAWEQEFKAGRRTVSTGLELARLLLKAELELAGKAEDRIQAHLEYYKLTCAVEEMMTAGYDAGRISAIDYFTARAERFDAEIGLRRAGGKPPRDIKPVREPAKD